jgi:hypothetical protein
VNDFLQASDVEALPTPPLLERLLFEQPLIPVAALAVLAIIAAIAFARRNQRRRGLIVAAALAAAAAGLALLATLVTTDREVLLERTQALIAATAAVDTTPLTDLLSEDASLRTAGSIARVLPDIETRGEILARAEGELRGRYRISSWEILDRQATLDGPNVARTQVRVGVEADQFSRTHYSWWRLHWERDPSGQWRCFEIEPLWIQFVGSNR